MGLFIKRLSIDHFKFGERRAYPKTEPRSLTSTLLKKRQSYAHPIDLAGLAGQRWVTAGVEMKSDRRHKPGPAIAEDSIEAFKTGWPRGTEAEHVPGCESSLMSGFEVRIPNTAQFASNYEAGALALLYVIPCFGQHSIHL